jgi:hypothetical protein
MVIGIFCKKIDMFVRVGSIPARLIKIFRLKHNWGAPGPSGGWKSTRKTISNGLNYRLPFAEDPKGSIWMISNF